MTSTRDGQKAPSLEFSGVARDVTSQLVVPGLDHVELVSLIETHFGSAKSLDRKTTRYPGWGPTRLEVTFKGDQIRTIRSAGDSAATTDIAQICARRDAELLVHVQEIWTDIFFASAAVRGGFRNSSGPYLLQIAEAPPNADRPETLYGEHPCIVQFRVLSSCNGFVTVKRCQSIRTQLGWLLTLFLNAILRPANSQSQRFWTFADQADLSTNRYTVAHECYGIAGLEFKRDEFKSITAMLPVKSHRNYYGEELGVMTDELEIPDSLDRSWTAIGQLSPDDRMRLHACAQWFYSAICGQRTSQSLAFVGLVAAIEALLPPPTSSGSCRSCQRAIGPGPTKRFRQFVDRYAADGSSTDDLYSLRSRIAHGGYFLAGDSGIHNLTERWMRDSDRARRMFQVVRQVAVNWLHDQSGRAQPE